MASSAVYLGVKENGGAVAEEQCVDDWQIQRRAWSSVAASLELLLFPRPEGSDKDGVVSTVMEFTNQQLPR